MAKTQTITNKASKRTTAVKTDIKMSEMTAAELLFTVTNLRLESAKGRMEAKAGKQKNVRKYFMLRKQIARALSYLNQKKTEENI